MTDPPRKTMIIIIRSFGLLVDFFHMFLSFAVAFLEHSENLRFTRMNIKNTNNSPKLMYTPVLNIFLYFPSLYLSIILVTTCG